MFKVLGIQIQFSLEIFVINHSTLIKRKVQDRGREKKILSCSHESEGITQRVVSSTEM